MLNFGYYNMDCMERMKKFPDKYFDLAVVDPPYFSGPEKRRFYGKEISTTGVGRKYYPKLDDWKVPNFEYFDELIRVSKEQIIFGCNYFNYHFSSGRIIWDKCNDGTSFSDAEIAYCSMHDSVKIFRYMWNGFMQGKTVHQGMIQRGNKKLNEKRIHPTQKPIDLYRFIVEKYCKPGFKILDTHVGSASSLIAYKEANLDFVGFEKDALMYELSKRRYEYETSQMTIFDFLKEKQFE